MSALSRFLSRMAIWVSVAGLVAMTAIICWQVFARYVLGNAPAWAEQASLFLMLCFILFAAAAGVREGFHIRITILQESVSESRAKLLAVICHVVVLLFGAFMAVCGFELVAETWQHDIPTLGISRGTSYLPLGGAGLLIVFFSVEQILALRRGEEVGSAWR